MKIRKVYNMYIVKNLKRKTGACLQTAIEYWLESRNHIQVMSINVWCDKEGHYATIVYKEEHYN